MLKNMSVSETSIKNLGRLTFSIKPWQNLGGDYMIPVGRYEILYRFARVQEVLDILYKLYFAKSFIQNLEKVSPRQGGIPLLYCQDTGLAGQNFPM